jgi:hypothetical protein
MSLDTLCLPSNAKTYFVNLLLVLVEITPLISQQAAQTCEIMSCTNPIHTTLA